MYVRVYQYVPSCITSGGECEIPPFGPPSRTSGKESGCQHGQLCVREGEREGGREGGDGGRKLHIILYGLVCTYDCMFSLGNGSV